MPSQKSADYSWVLTTDRLPVIQEKAIVLAELYDSLRLASGPGAASFGVAASKVRRALFALRGELQQIAVDIAKTATVIIKEEEARSRVRPDTLGDGGPRLEDSVGISEPLRSVPGSVGLNYMPILDATVPWWWTNEVGYSGHIGRVVHGFYYDAGFTGRARPDPSRFREHPLFRAEGPQSGAVLDRKEPPIKGGKGQRPGMLIKRPIPERRFVEKGGQRATALWHTAVQAAESRFAAKIEAIGRDHPPPPRP